MADTVEFEGNITSVTPDGRSGIVRLDKKIYNMEYVVISPSTVGRISLMNGIGRLRKQVMVQGLAFPGVDALIAKSVSLKDKEQIEA